MGCTFCLSCGVFVTFAIISAIWIYWKNSKKPKKTICILVLGDIGRSPRMQYHALSFAREGFMVDLVGYAGSEPLRDLRDNPAVKIHYLRSSNVQNMPRLLGYLIKTLTQTSVLLWKFFVDIDCSYVLVQNPPAVPTLLICWMYCRFAGARFVVDWHNYAFTIMSLGLGPKHILVTITRFFESFFGARADKNFCVTKAMRDDLKSKWGINAEVLYDRPPMEFKPIDLEEKHTLMKKLGKIYEVFGDGNDSSRFTECLESGEIRLRTDRPGFIVSSTSWTDDEDFSILFNALHEYEIACESGEYNLPDLVCAVTGKGPLKEFWNAIVQRKNWRHVKIVTPWLENEDYPKLLASADLGVSLHTSSSGLDLPMKVVDMFGCGLPVCAVNYNCLNELVRHEENSLVFSNEKELAQQLKTWFHNFPNNDEQREIKEKFQRELTKFRELRWHVETITGVNDRPIIGVLSQELSFKMTQTYKDDYHSFIAASYVKFVEGAGARAVPIWIGKKDAYYENVLSKINGVLFPGGATYFNQTAGYADAGKAIYRIAKRMNRNGDYFPIWGTCLGFELLTYVAANGTEHRRKCKSQRQALPLEFTNDFRESRMFKNAPRDVINILRKENVTANFHGFCITPQDLAKVSLTNEFRVMSMNKDWQGLSFISTLEHTSMPFYGVQFHPEKDIYEWIRGKAIPHSYSAIRASQYFANFFVNEARKNNHRFATTVEETENLIYKHPLTYTQLQGSAYQQCYLFKKSDEH